MLMELARSRSMKSILPWCIVLGLLAGLIAFYNSARSKESELSLLRQENKQVDRLRAENEELKKVQVPTEELARLRKENEEIHRLRNEIHQLRDEKQQAGRPGQPVPAAGASPKNDAASQQHLQQQLQQLMVENERLRTENLQFQQARVDAQANACVNNLRIIQGAKEQWALENKKPPGAVVSAADIQPYLRNNTLLSCPLGGVYTFNAVEAPPACSIPSHVFPAQ